MTFSSTCPRIGPSYTIGTATGTGVRTVFPTTTSYTASRFISRIVALITSHTAIRTFTAIATTTAGSTSSATGVGLEFACSTTATSSCTSLLCNRAFRALFTLDVALAFGITSEWTDGAFGFGNNYINTVVVRGREGRE